MIVWLNGAFGSGKTSVSKELYNRLEQAVLFDPEDTGIFLRRSVPNAFEHSDFQDHPLWVKLNYEILEHLYSEPHSYIIVPMTIVEKDKYDGLITKLRNNNMDVRVVSLFAEATTIAKRLEERGDALGSWAFDQIDRCITGLRNLDYDLCVDTEKLNIHEVTDQIEKTIIKAPGN